MSGKDSTTTLLEKGLLVMCDYCPAIIRSDKAISQFMAVDIDQMVYFCCNDCNFRWYNGSLPYGYEELQEEKEL